MNPTSKAKIGTTSVEVTRLGLGTAPMGGWPTEISHRDGHETIDAAWKRGFRYFDTAPFYGFGQSERWLGDILSSKPRAEFALSTKVGRLLVPAEKDEPSQFFGEHALRARFDFSAEGIRRSLEESLERLRIDRVDIVLVHDPDDHLKEALDGAFPALDRLRSEGVVGAIGAGMNWSEPLVYLAERTDLDCVLLAGRYTLLEQDSLDNLLPLAEEQQMSIIAGGVFNSGLMVDPGPGATYNYLPAAPELIARAQRLRDACALFGVSLKAAALQFPLAHPAVACVVTGARSRAELEENTALIQTPIPSELWEHLRERHLIRKEASLPEAQAR